MNMIELMGYAGWRIIIPIIVAGLILGLFRIGAEYLAFKTHKFFGAELDDSNIFKVGGKR